MTALAKGVGVSLLLSAVASCALIVTGRARAALILTGSCAVVIISGLWLERLASAVLQPGRPRLNKRVLWQGLARLAFVSAAAAALFFWGRPVDLVPAALGVVAAWVGWVWAGLRAY